MVPGTSLSVSDASLARVLSAAVAAAGMSQCNAAAEAAAALTSDTDLGKMVKAGWQHGAVGVPWG